MFRFVVIIGAVAAMDLIMLPESDYGDKGARCLDGTMSGYYYEHPPSGESDVWVISLGDGGRCTYQAHCAKRAYEDGYSSKNWWQTIPSIYMDFMSNDLGRSTTILSNDESKNPDFFSAHHVFLPYCNADGWSGTVVTPTETQWGFHFSGHLNFELAVEHIWKTIPATRNATRILLTGYSAGGFGAMLHCDFLQDKLASMGSAAKVSCAPNSAWFSPGFAEDQDDVEMPPSMFEQWSTGKSPSGGQAAMPSVLEIWQSYVHPGCIKGHASEDAAERCGSASVFYPYIKSPMYVMQNQYDSDQLLYELGLPESKYSDPLGQAFIAYFGRAMRNSTQQILGTSNGLFSPSCLDMLGLGVGGYIEVKGFTSAQGLGDWFFGRGNVPAVLVDDCEMRAPGLPCNPTCEHYSADSDTPSGLPIYEPSETLTFYM